MRSLFAVLCFFLSSYLVSCSCVRLPDETPSSILSDTARLRHDVVSVVRINGYRNYSDSVALNSAASFIRSEFLKISSRVEIQSFKADGKTYRNIICSLGPDSGKRIVVGAHYDVCGNQPGADDNASGVAGLLELGRLLNKQPLKTRFDLVAFTLEEPPFFKTNQMGSYVHASYLYNNRIPVKGMVCLEMIGYFNDAPHSQKYPLGFLSWFYGNKGDYITVVHKFGKGKFCRQFNRAIRKNLRIKTGFFNGPKGLAGIDFSDHRNYWSFGYDALMITNTAFYRDFTYHTSQDVIENLDFKRMAQVVDEVYLALLCL